MLAIGGGRLRRSSVSVSAPRSRGLVLLALSLGAHPPTARGSASAVVRLDRRVAVAAVPLLVAGCPPAAALGTAAGRPLRRGRRRRRRRPSSAAHGWRSRPPSSPATGSRSSACSSRSSVAAGSHRRGSPSCGRTRCRSSPGPSSSPRRFRTAGRARPGSPPSRSSSSARVALSRGPVIDGRRGLGTLSID